jgi:toxin FitB
MTLVALDTSVAVPYLMESHRAHRTVRDRLHGVAPVLTSHSLAETYSVLTRLPGDTRLSPADAVRLLDDAFGGGLAPLAAERASGLPAILAPLAIVGGAVYDALVALAAIDAGALLLTRDRRAAGTYAALAARVEIIPDHT